MSITAGMPTTIKKVTLELIYDAVDERAREIKDRIDGLEKRLGRLEDDMRELRSEMNRRFEAMEQKFAALNARMDQLFPLITNQRKDS